MRKKNGDVMRIALMRNNTFDLLRISNSWLNMGQSHLTKYSPTINGHYSFGTLQANPALCDGSRYISLDDCEWSSVKVMGRRAPFRYVGVKVRVKAWIYPFGRL